MPPARRRRPTSSSPSSAADRPGCAGAPRPFSPFSLDAARRPGMISLTPSHPPHPTVETAMRRLFCAVLPLFALVLSVAAEPQKDQPKKDQPKKEAAKVEVGGQAPQFKIMDSNGKEIDLAELTAKGPVL